MSAIVLSFVVLASGHIKVQERPLIECKVVRGEITPEQLPCLHNGLIVSMDPVQLVERIEVAP
jgi:hypothetical protein